MANIKQAIFTVTPELLINDQHSKYVNDVFGLESISGSDLNFLFNEEQKEKTALELTEGLELAFLQPETWEMISPILLDEHVYFKPNKVGGDEKRDLKFEWNPIFVKDKLVKIMVICLDVTDQKRLESEIANQEAAHDEQLEILSQIIALPVETVEQFVKDTSRMVKETDTLLNKAKQGMDQNTLSGLMRTMHTIKGSARHFKLISIQDKAHDLESHIVEISESDHPQEKMNSLYSQLVQEWAPLKSSVNDVEIFYRKTMNKGSDPKEDLSGTVSIPVKKIERILSAVTNTNRKTVPTRAVQNSIRGLIQVPAKTLFDRLESLARALADELKHPLIIERNGDETLMDFRMAGPLHDGFLHAIRNSIDHGAEDVETRLSKGKDAPMHIKMHAKISYGHLIIEISDDGAGIDVEKVREKVIQRGLVHEEKFKHSPSDRVVQYIFEPGLSTKEQVSDISGRGVGMDVVKDVVEGTLAGEIFIYTEKDKGTRLVARIPSDRFTVQKENLYGLFSSSSKIQEIKNSLNSNVEAYSKIKNLNGIPTIITDIEALKEKTIHLPKDRSHVICLGDVDPKTVAEQVLPSHRVQHYVDVTNPFHSRYLKSTLGSIGNNKIWGLENYLWPGVEIFSHDIRDYNDKNSIIDRLTEITSRQKAFISFSEIMSTIADEMIMNGMFDAPRDKDGKEKYNHLSRTHKLVLEPSETVNFRFGIDGNFIGLSISDPFGALTYDTLINYLQRCFAQGSDQINQTKGGAGLGLFSIFSSSHCFIVNRAPNRRTEVISLVSLSRSFERYQRVGRSFSFFDNKEL